MCRFVEQMTTWFPGSEAFTYKGRNVYARQDVGTDYGTEFRHSAVGNNNSTVSAALIVLADAGITVIFHYKVARKRLVIQIVHRPTLLTTK